MPDVASELVQLASAYGVAVEYWDWRGEHVTVAADTLRAVLTSLGVDASTDQACRDALELKRSQAWRSVFPPYAVAHEGRSRTIDVHVDHGAPLSVSLYLEDGTQRALAQVDNWTPPREVDGRQVGEASFAIPGDIEPGYHRLVATTNGVEYTCALIVAPSWLGVPGRMGRRPAWGLATQLYSARSARSWGVGDLVDLEDLAAWAGGEHGAAFVLVNPMHAAEPVPPMNPSPYLPTTRRFANPLYLRIEAVPEYAYLDAAARQGIEALGALAREQAGVVDRDTSWTAKRAALVVLHHGGLTPGREAAFRAFCRREGETLDDFATWCVLSEDFGPDWHDWPEPLRHPRGPVVAQFREHNAGRVDFHRWLQWLLDEQLAHVQDSSRHLGMSLGIVHDLAVGVSPSGADSWSWQDDMAQGITVGAPPDPYAQTGQNWSQPPWRPDRLAARAYEPFRDLMRSVLRHSGGLRIDHVMGLFRLWWIPDGALPTAGTYVSYDHEAAIGVLMLEAYRAGAVVIGEDLGTVEPWVRDYLRERGILGTSILWFEFDWDADGAPLPPERWREYCLASVTTHDLPPTAGYLAGDHVELRHRLGLLTRPLEEELAADQAERSAWLGLLRERGLLPESTDSTDSAVSTDSTDSTDELATTLALHKALRAAPSQLRCLSLADAVGERRTQNQPGTKDEYPNWRVPLGGPDGRPVLIEDLFTSERAAALAEAMRDD